MVEDYCLVIVLASKCKLPPPHTLAKYKTGAPRLKLKAAATYVFTPTLDTSFTWHWACTGRRSVYVSSWLC